MHFSLKQALTWLVIILCAGIIISGLYQHTSESNTKSETIVATDWKIIKTNIGGSTYSEEDDDYEIGDNIRLNVKVSFDLNGGEISPDFPLLKSFLQTKSMEHYPYQQELDIILRVGIQK